MMAWSAGTLQSRTRRGLVTARRWQSSHSLVPDGDEGGFLCCVVPRRGLGGADGVEVELPA